MTHRELHDYFRAIGAVAPFEFCGECRPRYEGTRGQRIARGQCPVGCGLKDVRLPKRKPDQTADHLCVMPWGHQGPHEFIGTCGRNRGDPGR